MNKITKPCPCEQNCTFSIPAQQVGSLTGRTIPRTWREKLKQQRPALSVVNKNIRTVSEDSHVVKPNNSVEEHDKETQCAMPQSASAQQTVILTRNPSDKKYKQDTEQDMTATHTDKEEKEAEKIKQRTSIVDKAAFWDSRIELGQSCDAQVTQEFPYNKT